MYDGSWRGLKTLLLLLMLVLPSPVGAQVGTYPRVRLSDGAQDRLVGVTPNNGLQAEQIDLTTTGTITALNGSVQLAIQGAAGAGYLLTGTWTATVQAQISLDGGTTWVAVDSYNFANELVALNISANSSYAVSDMRGASHVRVTATAFTSGTMAVTLRASQAAQLQNTKFDAVPTSAVPNHAAMVGGSDGTNLQTFRTATALPAAASVGLVIREASQGQATMANSRPVVIASDQSNVPANVTQFGGTNIVTGTGASGLGIPRVTLSNDSSLAANQSVNMAQINGVTPLMGNGNTGTGSPRVTNVDNDPCQTSGRAKSNVSVALSATGAAQILAASGSTTIYVCGFGMTISGTTTPAFRFEYGTGTNCATGNTALTGAFGGGTQAATGQSVTYGPGSTIFATSASQALCINPSGTAPSIQGVVTYVQQ